MDFNQLIFDKFGLIFRKNNFLVKEQFENFLKLESDKIIMTIGYVEQENSCYLFVGGKETPLYSIDENVFKNVFKTTLKINNVKAEVFVNNIVAFFEGEGISLIEGNIDTLKAVGRYVYKESKEYTLELLMQQNIEAANTAWAKGNYKDFLICIDKIDRKNLPASYELKYKLARQKLYGI